MKRLGLIVILCFFAGTALGTFEIADPANQIIEELDESRELQEERDLEQERELEKALEETTLCAISAEANVCFCINEETGNRVPLTEEECVARVSDAANALEP